jgi:hypothetical protein
MMKWKCKKCSIKWTWPKLRCSPLEKRQEAPLSREYNDRYSDRPYTSLKHCCLNQVAGLWMPKNGCHCNACTLHVFVSWRLTKHRQYSNSLPVFSFWPKFDVYICGFPTNFRKNLLLLPTCLLLPLLQTHCYVISFILLMTSTKFTLTNFTVSPCISIHYV